MSQSELDDLLSQLLDNKLSQAEFSKLEKILESSEEARSMYIDYMALNDVLEGELAARTQSGLAPVVPIDEIIRRQRKKYLKASLVAAAALVVISLIPMLLMQSERESSLVFNVAPGTLYSVEHTDGKPMAGELVLRKGSRLTIEQGTVELTFKSDVKSIVSGPADLTLLQGNVLELKNGKAWFHVPQGAEGFTVHTKSLEVVDLGTEFGVISKPNGSDEIHVFKGKVRASAWDSIEEAIELVAGQARVIGEANALVSTETREHSFLTSLPDSLPYLHWSFDGDIENNITVDGSLATDEKVVAYVDLPSGDSCFEQIDGKFGKAVKSDINHPIETNWYGVSGDQPRIVAYWVKLNDTEGKGYIPVMTTGQQRGTSATECRAFYTYVDTGGSGLSFGGHWVYGATRVDDGQWHHVVFVYTGKHLMKGEQKGDPEIRCYVDGRFEELKRYTHGGVARDELGDITVDTASKDTGAAPLTLFSNNLGGWAADFAKRADLALDDLYFFQGALTAEEVRALFEKR
jgi:hypothetical protein